jgi:hypothetical protein
LPVSRALTCGFLPVLGPVGAGVRAPGLRPRRAGYGVRVTWPALGGDGYTCCYVAAEVDGR